MLNIYKYYSEAESLPLFNDVHHLMDLFKDFSWLNKKYKKDMTDDDRDQVKAIVMKSAELAFKFAQDIMGNKPWPEAEPTIAKNGSYAGLYAINILHHRFKQAEPNIMINPTAAGSYAQYILAKDPEWTKTPGHENGRWPEAEPYIIKNDYAALYYAINVLKKRWKEYEDIADRDSRIWEMYLNFFEVE